MVDMKIQSLADTLARTGIVCSSSDALRMAAAIAGTEQKVVSKYNSAIKQPDKPKYNSYQEEIDDLIRKTNPMTKDYHIPVKGYKRSVPLSDQVGAASVIQSISSPAALTPAEQPRQEQPKAEPAQAIAQEPLHAEIEAVEKIDLSIPMIQPSVPAELDNAKPLKELMEEQAKENHAPQTAMEGPQISVRDADDDFIVPLEVKPAAPSQQNQLLQEIKQEKKPAVPKSPIEKVDLMNFFRVK